MKKGLKWIALVMAGTTIMTGLTACGKTPFVNTGDVVKKDENKTQLYVGCYEGGVGREWLDSAIKRFEKQYFDFNLIIDKNQFLADISTPELLNTAKLDCDFALTDSRFYIEKVDFHLPSSGLSYIVNNSAQTQLFTFTSLIM